MTEEQARFIFAQVALGLQDMHSVGLLHRDIKLLNIFMCNDKKFPRVKLGDLGLSALLKTDKV